MWAAADYYDVIVANEWRALFGLAEVAPDDDFLELGGTSLGAVALAAGLADELGRPVSASLVLETRMPSRLAAALRASMGVPLSGAVELGRAGDPAVVAIHPIGGGVMWYRELADALAPMSCIGIQSLALTGGRVDYPDLPAMAADYLAQIEGVRPLRDTVLAGYSWGGLVAFEIACQAVAAGCPPLGLVLFDAVVPGVEIPRERLMWTIACHALALDVDAGDLVDLDSEQLADRLCELQRRSSDGAQAVSASRIRRLLDIYEVNAGLQRSYRPHRYGGDALFIQPTTQETPGGHLYWSSRCERLPRAFVEAAHADLLVGDAARAAAGHIKDVWLPTQAGASRA